MPFKFQPEFMEVEFNFSAMASVVSLSENSIEINGHFRAYSDYVGLTFYSADFRMHQDARYPKNKDYTGVKLSFSATFSGEVSNFNDLIQLPAISVYYEDGSEKVASLPLLIAHQEASTESFSWFIGPVTLNHKTIKWYSESVRWEKEVVIGYEDIFDSDGMYIRTIEITELRSGYAIRESDYVIDYVNGIIAPVAGAEFMYASDIIVSYEYHYGQDFLIDFDNLYEGTHPNYSTPISPLNIVQVVFPIIPTYYVEGRNELTGRSDEIKVTFTNWTVTGGELGAFPVAKSPHPFRTAEGYDDEYYRNPYRIIQSMYHLGYRKIINLYIGASHYYDKIGIAGESSIDYTNQRLIPTIGVSTAAKQWFRYLLKAMALFGFEDIIISVSMENLQMLEEWKQRLHNGEAGRTGWEPPTSFFSPTNADVRVYWEKIARDYLDIAVSESFTPILQLGEPWWWWQEFIAGDVNTPYPGRPPCFYDEATKNLYQSETGKSLPIFTESDIPLTPENLEAIDWLSDKLGMFSDFAKNIVKSYTGGLYTVLFFPPSVLDESRVPEAIRRINYPNTFWKNGNLDFIQIEDYDWLVNNNVNHPKIYDFTRNPQLRYQPHLAHYFAGFAWAQYPSPLSVQWERIENGATKALSYGFKEVFIWAGTQIRRDSWNPKIPIKYIPNIINKVLVNMEGDK